MNVLNFFFLKTAHAFPPSRPTSHRDITSLALNYRRITFPYFIIFLIFFNYLFYVIVEGGIRISST